MAPNLFVACQTAVQPQKWFRKPSPPCQIKHTEEWAYPVPGKYRHTSRGWFLVATKDRDLGSFVDLEPADWQRVIYWHPKHRFELQRALEQRSQSGFIEGKKDQKAPVRFYCMPDDGATWIQAWDKNAPLSEPESVPGPYKRYILDAESRKFVIMTKGDERAIRRNFSSRPSTPLSSEIDLSSPASSLHLSRAGTPVISRKNSTELEQSETPQGKRASLMVPDSRPMSRESRSRSTSPSPLSTPVTVEDLKDLEDKMLATSTSDVRHSEDPVPSHEQSEMRNG